MDNLKYIVDFLLIFLSIVIVVSSAKKGFAKSILDFCASLASLFLAYMFGKPIAQFLFDKLIATSVSEKIAEKIGESSIVDTVEQIRAVIQDLPSWVSVMGDKIGIDISSVTDSIAGSEHTAQAVASEITDSLIKPVAVILLTVLCAAVIFVIATIVLSFVVKALDKIFKLPIIGSVNTALGALLGLVRAVMFVFVICSVIFLVGSISDGELAQAFCASRLASFVNSFNPIISVFE